MLSLTNASPNPGVGVGVGVTVGVGGSLIGIHWSLAISAGVLFALLAFGFALATRWRS